MRKVLKCDKSFRRAAFAYARFNTDFTVENAKHYYRSLKARHIEIKNVKKLSSVGWDDLTKRITLDLIVAFNYIEIKCYKFIKSITHMNKIYIYTSVTSYSNIGAKLLLTNQSKTIQLFG